MYLSTIYYNQRDCFTFYDIKYNDIIYLYCNPQFEPHEYEYRNNFLEFGINVNAHLRAVKITDCTIDTLDLSIINLPPNASIILENCIINTVKTKYNLKVLNVFLDNSNVSKFSENDNLKVIL